MALNARVSEGGVFTPPKGENSLPVRDQPPAAVPKLPPLPPQPRWPTFRLGGVKPRSVPGLSPVDFIWES
jgi:hypothetical protein